MEIEIVINPGALRAQYAFFCPFFTSLCGVFFIKNVTQLTPTQTLLYYSQMP